MKKVAIIGTVGIPSKYGGFETLAQNLSIHLKNKFQLYVYCSRSSYSKEERIKELNGAKLVYIPFKANGIQSIIYDIISMLHAIFYADTLIVLGVSGGILIPLLRFFTRKKIIVNIDGLEWRRAKWGKWTKKFLKFSERMAVRYSHIDITDNMGIKRYTSINYKTLSRLIAYGGDHAEPQVLSIETLKSYPFLAGKYAFKVARIEPENNVHLIIKAFSQYSYPLVIIGNWNSSEYGKNLKLKYQDYENIHLIDAIYDQNILDQFRSNCDIYIHGHSAGGTNPSLVEAMHLNIPILCYDVVYNKETTQYKGHYFKNENEIMRIIDSTTSEEWKRNARNMKIVAEREYSWKVISQKYTNLILSLDHKYTKQFITPKLSQLKQENLNKNALGHFNNITLYFE